MDDRIKELRKALNLTQQEFADMLGTSRNNIAGYETGRRLPSDAVISLICKTFDVSWTWLRTGEGEMFEPDPEEKEFLKRHAMTDLEMDIIKAYFDLDLDVREKLLLHFQTSLSASAREREADRDYEKELQLEAAARVAEEEQAEAEARMNRESQLEEEAWEEAKEYYLKALAEKKAAAGLSAQQSNQ